MVNTLKAGDRVVYRPSLKGAAVNAANPTASVRLQPGAAYVVAQVNGDYVTVCGHEHPAGGLFWTEFDRPAAV